jgi:hypothetical protein
VGRDSNFSDSSGAGRNPCDKDSRDKERREILERMAKAEADQGLYGLIPNNVRPKKRAQRRHP